MMDFSKLKRTSIHERKVGTERQRAQTTFHSGELLDFWKALPEQLKVRELRALVDAILRARERGKPILFMMGAHSIKVGLSPWLIEAMQRGFITALALNGACLVHDFELAYAGNTSEDVAESLLDGSFGMTLETGKYLNEWIVQAAEQNQGLGTFISKQLYESGFPYVELSLLATAWQQKVPVTVHVALGTDVIHHHPEASGAAIGQTSMIDFHSLCETVARLGDGGVVLNVGSNVILPEVFLKALTVARNLHGRISHFTTANFDMIGMPPQYQRGPASGAGRWARIFVYRAS